MTKFEEKLQEAIVEGLNEALSFEISTIVEKEARQLLRKYEDELSAIVREKLRNALDDMFGARS